jgi:hypothetical protein
MYAGALYFKNRSKHKAIIMRHRAADKKIVCDIIPFCFQKFNLLTRKMIQCLYLAVP